ncbi:MAG TPA: class I SAM-dependent methyltransferase [Acidimicrobiales bacterium]|nr:class I SAM-dependent methyltransferase [Acidimicrobiales bacterium]
MGAMSDPIRYDAVADWYVDFSRGWAPYALLPGDVTGQRVLDLACAWGTASRYLAERGARVTGLDLSGQMLARARQLEVEQPLGITYVQGDATGTDWWDGTPFDGVLSNMALMDIDDLDGAVRTIAVVLRPGGWLSFSIIHPCFPGRPGVQPSWPPDGGYGREGWWNTRGDGVRGHVGSNHRMLSTYLNTLLGAGLAVEEVAERDRSLPTTLLARCRRV